MTTKSTMAGAGAGQIPPNSLPRFLVIHLYSFGERPYAEKYILQASLFSDGFTTGSSSSSGSRGGAATWMLPLNAGGALGRLSASSRVLAVAATGAGATAGVLGTETPLLEPAFTAERLVLVAAVFEADCILVWPADAVCESAFAASAGCGAERTGGWTGALACERVEIA